MEHREKIVLVTGVSEEIGNACATFAAKRGFKTYGSCPNPASYEKKADEFFELIQMNVEDDASVARAAEVLLAKEKCIDALVCCSGKGFLSSIEDCSFEEVRLLFESNLYSAIRTIKAFLPAMREARSGRIVVAAPLAAGSRLPGLGLCSAAARAVEAVIDALRVEIGPYGIQACVLEVGPIRAIFPGFPSCRRISRHEKPLPPSPPLRGRWIGETRGGQRGGSQCRESRPRPHLVAPECPRGSASRPSLPASRPCSPAFFPWGSMKP